MTTAAYTNGSCVEGIRWVFDSFGTCIVTAQDYSSFVIGMISLCVWFLPLLPQMYKNYVRGGCDEALSIYFVIFWFFGDSMNLGGSVLTGQLPTQIFIAIAYVFQDACALFQYIYYSAKKRWKGRKRDSKETSPKTNPHSSKARRTSTCCLICFGLQLAVPPAYGMDFVQSSYTRSDEHADANAATLIVMFSETLQGIGYAMGCLSTVCYMSGRVLQLRENIKRKSTAGVSIATFWLIIVANVTYGTSVSIGGSGINYYVLHLPWLLGSFGCIFMDAIMMFQYYYWYNPRYRSKVEPTAEETIIYKSKF